MVSLEGVVVEDVVLVGGGGCDMPGGGSASEFARTSRAVVVFFVC